MPMRNYLNVILTMILLALLGIGFLLYQTYKLNRDSLKYNVAKMVDETSDKIFVTTTQDTVFVESNGEKEPMGTVTGKICYPSQSIPPLTLYFKNVENGEIANMDTDLNQDTYELETVPGSYVAYAYIKGLDERPGGYTEFVPCGLTTDCTDHSLIEFKVVDDGLTSDIDVCDWYGAVVPEE